MKRLFGLMLAGMMLFSVPAYAETHETDEMMEMSAGYDLPRDGEFPAPDLTIVEDEDDPSGLPVGTVYYTNVPDVEGRVECYIQVFDEYGDLVESFYDPENEIDGYRVLRLVTMNEDPLETGDYTIIGQYFMYDEETGEEIYGEETEITYSYERPSSSYDTPSVGWKNGRPEISVPDGLSGDCLLVMYVGYFYNEIGDGYLPLEESWAYVNANWSKADLQDVFETELEWLQSTVDERIEESAYLADGFYRYRVRIISDDICAKYHSDWSEWCEVDEMQGGGVDVILTPETVVQWESGVPVIDVSVLEQATDVENVKVMAALYDENGRCIDIVMADYDEETGYDLSDFNVGGANTTAKAFLCGNYTTPLCEESVRP